MHAVAVGDVFVYKKKSTVVAWSTIVQLPPPVKSILGDIK